MHRHVFSVIHAALMTPFHLFLFLSCLLTAPPVLVGSLVVLLDEQLVALAAVPPSSFALDLG